MLRECLSSILSQSFSDYEVIVGNDYVKEVLSSEAIGITDLRLRFVNHPACLGEIANMNALLDLSRGRYFTWLADDDMYAPEFLEAVHKARQLHPATKCVFTSYVHGLTYDGKRVDYEGKAEHFTGREFLRKYLSRELKTQGCYGVYTREHILQIGGMQKLGNGFSPYSDVLLAIQAGLLDELVFINSPLVFFRTHPDSFSNASADIESYMTAQRDFVPKSVSMFRAEQLKDDFDRNMELLVRWFLKDFCSVMRRTKKWDCQKVKAWAQFHRTYVLMMKHRRLPLAFSIFRNLLGLRRELSRND